MEEEDEDTVITDVDEEEEEDEECYNCYYDNDEDESSEKGGIRSVEKSANDDKCQKILASLLEDPFFSPTTTTTTNRSPTFMIMDVVMQRSKNRRHTEALLLGRERGGGSVCVTVSGWHPYLLIRAPVGMMNESACDKVRDLFEDCICNYMSMEQAPPSRNKIPYILAVTLLHNYQNIFGYASSGAGKFLKIEVAYPHLVNILRDVLVGYPKAHFDGESTTGYERVPGMMLVMEPWTEKIKLITGESETFNSNLDAVLQFMVDAGLQGCQWCTLSDAAEEAATKKSTCTYEMQARLEDLRVIEDDDSLAPLRVLSFDIEAAGRRGVFPQPEIDPVIQIALQFYIVGGAPPPPPILLSLMDCDPIEGATVVSFENEAKLLEAFRDLVVAFDTDVFSGYNICGFDFGYLQNRAEALQVEDFNSITRLHKGKMVIRETEFFSAQMGKQRRVKVTIPGRAVLDMLMAIRNNQSYRLEKYTLDAVSSYFLGDHKKDVHFTQITPMWLKDSASRKELGEYCLHDAKLPIDLMLKLDALTQTIEMARAVGVPFDFVLQRGQMIRNASLLLRRAKERYFVFPNKTPFSRQKTVAVAASTAVRYQGATVLDPICGIHNMVGVVDFSAMYPSIMRAHNICASTIVLDERHPFYKPSPGAVTRDEIAADDEARGLLRVCGHVFVSDVHVKGLIPEVVELLQHCRTKAKKAFAEATDPLQKKVAKARELAYKVAGNGVYGALGSALSLVPLMAIAETVTAIGRMDIMTVKKTAETMFPDSVVVYGKKKYVFFKFFLNKFLS